MEGVMEYIKQSYDNPPVYILENGKSMKGDFQLQQKDTLRIDYLQAYIGAVLKAVRNGSDTRGYFVWSLTDLYELLDGYGSDTRSSSQEISKTVLIRTTHRAGSDF